MLASSLFGRRRDLASPSNPNLSVPPPKPLPPSYSHSILRRRPGTFHHLSSISTPELQHHQEVPAKRNRTRNVVGAIRAFLSGRKEKVCLPKVMSTPALFVTPPPLHVPKGILTASTHATRPVFSFNQGTLIVQDGLEAAKAFKDLVTASDFNVHKVKFLTLIIDANHWSEALDASLTSAMEAFVDGHDLATLRVWIKGNTLFTQRNFVLSRGAIEFSGMMAHSAVSAYHPYWVKLCESNESREDMRHYSPVKKAAKQTRELVKVLLARLHNISNVYVAGAMPTTLKEAIIKACQSRTCDSNTDERLQANLVVLPFLSTRLYSLNDQNIDIIRPILDEELSITKPNKESWDNYILDITNQLPTKGLDEEIVRIGVSQSGRECQFGWKVFFVDGRWKIMRGDELN
jgi:hypothetical protein